MRDVMSTGVVSITWARAAVAFAISLAATAAAEPVPPPGATALAPVAFAKCGDSAFSVVPPAQGGAATLQGLVATGGNRWAFTASIGLARVGTMTRTLTVEGVHTQERKPPRAKDVAPSGLFIDLLLGDRKLLLRHASEGGGDPAYAVDLDRCAFNPGGDAALAALAVPPEPIGCAPEVVSAGYRTQVTRAENLPDADADREALALCEDHQKTIEARIRLEQTISDRAARDRIAARGAALLRTEDVRMKTWNRIDACLSTDPASAHSVPALHNIESKVRACYAKIAAKL